MPSYGSPDYSRSTGTYDPGGGPPQGPAVQPFSSNSGVAGFGGFAPGGGNHTLYASGGIIAAFPWNSSAPVPQSVIVMQSCVAAWYSASSGTPVTGTCDNGMHGTQRPFGPSPGPPGYSASGTCGNDSSGNPLAVYSVVAGASPLVLPTVTVNAKVVGDAMSGQLQASVSYTAAVYPVTITLTGAIQDGNGNYQALCGQQITASLNCPLAKVTGYDWARSGNLIKTYNPSFATGQVVSLSDDAGDFTGSKLYFYDVNNNDTASATCYANITLPDGTAQVVSATSPTVTFRKPTALWTVKEGFIQPFTFSQYPGATLYGLAADPSSATTYPNGEDWFPVDIMMPS